jgi:four helix bundle protein
MPNTTPRYFDHERLDAYRWSRQAVQLVSALKPKLRGLPGGIAAQLERAVAGAHSNLSSGAAARGAEKRRQLSIARSEASEAGGVLDLPLDLGVISRAEYDELREVLLRLCACLGGLIRRG